MCVSHYIVVLILCLKIKGNTSGNEFLGQSCKKPMCDVQLQQGAVNPTDLINWRSDLQLLWTSLALYSQGKHARTCTHTHTHTHTPLILELPPWLFYFSYPETIENSLSPAIFPSICCHFQMLISSLTPGQWQSHHNADLTLRVIRILRQKFYYFAFTKLTFSHSHVVKVQETHKTIWKNKYCSFLFPKKFRYQILISLKSINAGSSKVEGGSNPPTFHGQKKLSKETW